MFLTYIGIILSLLTCLFLLASFILFYQGVIIKTQRKLGNCLKLSLAIVGVCIVMCYVGTFVL